MLHKILRATIQMDALIKLNQLKDILKKVLKANSIANNVWKPTAMTLIYMGSSKWPKLVGYDQDSRDFHII